ncbi:MAG: hypothetical protein CMD81_03870 [Gammaproteobacteria bacterium]|nr:hypothetical protein [Gammaproteobacteria bacterium]HBF07400.1 hypothetical protein [Gammaproteobacteria bacterium]|tara:strand:- start:13982 stop:16219 length:2238 start_codon:yes stop_codon:yes gene_type:complete
MTDRIHYFGIRHHGPGSSRLLVSALNDIQPSLILIEGPSDCSDLIPLLCNAETTLPVALLSYAATNAECSSFFPFAEYSPEYQACLWGQKTGAQTAFIDLPMGYRLAQAIKQDDKAQQREECGQVDPIGLLARTAGYEDGESWWNDVIEEHQESHISLFAAIENAIAALREDAVETGTISQQDLIREAYMRLEIKNQCKAHDGPVVVVTGAWHTPALQEKHSLKDDKALLKGLPKKLTDRQIKSTWIPWTTPRLAKASGYGAGVQAPMWYQHLWQHQHNPHQLEHWIAQIAALLRLNGHVVSTASVIEATRLSHSLSHLRQKQRPGFEEVREAVIACLCYGESLQWQQIQETLLLGHDVGRVASSVPLVPLLEDLQVQQKAAKLKAEALQREVSLDLRTPIGLAKSTLLHRLRVLGVPWGQSIGAGKSRGTFREKWVLAWEPEFAINLVENLAYGSTLEQAANNKVIEALAHETQLPQLADCVLSTLESQLSNALAHGIQRLSQVAAQTNDVNGLLKAIPSLIDIHRYGTARTLPMDEIAVIIERLAAQAAIALPYAAHGIDAEEAAALSQLLLKAHRAFDLFDLSDDLRCNWWSAIWQLIEHSSSHKQLVGCCAYLWYADSRFKDDELKHLFGKNLSAAIPVQSAAYFFEGFFGEAAQVLRYEKSLLAIVNQWIQQLEEDKFIECLPLFRRVFMNLDALERQSLLHALINKKQQGQEYRMLTHILPVWSQQMQQVGALFTEETV